MPLGVRQAGKADNESTAAERRLSNPRAGDLRPETTLMEQSPLANVWLPPKHAQHLLVPMHGDEEHYPGTLALLDTRRTVQFRLGW